MTLNGLRLLLTPLKSAYFQIYLKSLLFVFCITISFTNGANAQTTPLKEFDIKKMVPTSPEAAMMARFGDIPIGYYTGTADISIPMYTIREGGLEIPIVLRYHGSGIKVEDQASNVGLGWNLDPGGAVVQIVSGKPDYFMGDLLATRANYAQLKATLPPGIYYQRRSYGTWGCLADYDPQHPVDPKNMMDELSDGYGQPDIFQFNFSGYSGKFYVHPETHQPVILEKSQHLKIVVQAESIIITTLDGNIFYFDIIEYSTPAVLSGPMSAAEKTSITYKLSKILFHNGKEINFEYQDGFFQWQSYSETYHSEYPVVTSPNLVERNPTEPTYSKIKTLRRIVTNNEIVDFNLEDRQDLNTSNTESIAPAKRIQSVDISNKSGKKIKTFDLTYDYFLAPTVSGSYVGSSYLEDSAPTTSYTPTDYDKKRLKLLSVREAGYTSTNQKVQLPPYEFTYDETVQLPLKTSYARDFWGYYNGQNNTKMIPDLSFFYFSNDLDYLDMPENIIQAVQGANRSPDVVKMKAGMLKKVAYPTGGYTEFDYEPHDFNNEVYPDIAQINAAKVNATANDYNRMSDVKTINFTLSKTQNITFYNAITRGPNTSLDFWAMQPAYIQLTKTVGGVTTEIKKWQMVAADQPNFNGSFQWIESITLPYIANAQYTITTSLPDALGPQNGYPNVANATSTFSYYAPPVNYLTSYGGGLRVSGIRNYNASNQLANNKIIKYIGEDNLSSGLLMSPVKPLYKRTMYGATLNLNADGTPNYQFYSLPVWFISSESVVPFSTAADGNVIGYSRVEELEFGTGNIPKGKRVFYYDNHVPESHPNVPDIPFTSIKNGMIKKEQVFGNGIIPALTETTYDYGHELTDPSYSGVKIFSAYVGSASPCHGNMPFAGQAPLIANWSIVSYPIFARWHFLQSKQTKELFNGNYLVKSETYNYNTLGQLIKSEIYNSKQEKTTVKLTYPEDELGDEAAMLRQKHLYKNLLEEIVEINDVEKSRYKFTYTGGINNFAFHTKTERSLNSGPLNEIATFDNDANKNIRQVTKENLSTAFLWGYGNSRILAAAKNALYKDIWYEGFEEAGGNSSSGDSRAGLKSKTGGYSKSLMNLTSTLKYTLTYWQKVSGNWVLQKVTDITPSGGNYTISLSGQVDEVRFYPKDALMTTYTYDTLVGITSMTDEKGMTTKYEYDPFQRLKLAKDQKGDILKAYDYHYKGQ